MTQKGSYFPIWSAKNDLSIFICVPLATYMNFKKKRKILISINLSHQVFVILCLDPTPPIYFPLVQGFVTINLEYKKLPNQPPYEESLSFFRSFLPCFHDYILNIDLLMSHY